MVRIQPHFPRTFRSLTLVTALAVGVLGGISGPPLAAAAATPAHIDHPVKLGKSVKGSPASHKSASQKPASSKTVDPGKATFTTGTAYAAKLAKGTAPALKFAKTSVVGKPATVDGPWQKLGTTGLQVAPATTAASHADTVAPSDASEPSRTPAASDSLRVTVLNHAQAKALGISGLALTVTRSDDADTSPIALQVPDSLLSSVYGADFASRAQWVEIPDQTSGGEAKTETVASARLTSGDATVVTPTMSTQSITLAAAGSPSSSTGGGTFAATPLNDASKWDVSAQTGDFSWTYDMRIPPAAAGPTPDLGLNYDSQSVDGETAATNNQPSTIGDGWTLGGSGYISRQYVSCSEDDGTGGAHTTSGDECWKQDNATISFAGHSGTLIKVTGTTGNSTWKLQSDDGTKFDYLTGTSCSAHTNGTWDNDCWRMTTTDGTKYYFGLDYLPGWTTGKAVTNSAWTVPVFGDDASEPCHASTFTASFCKQAWRWNLDYVVDPHGNAEALYYNAETNHYQQYTTSATKVIATYTRGGQIDHIDYGFKDGNAFVAHAASDKVTFGYDADGRCTHAVSTGATDYATKCHTEALSGAAVTPTSATTYYPDVPFDQNCTSTTSCPNLLSPTFWTTAMLNTVTTSDLVGTTYATVDEWYLCHSFPAAGDSTSALWLTSVTSNGCAPTRATPAQPDTTFTGVQMQNRVDANNDGMSLLDKWRISSVQTSLGAVISVNYSAQQCTDSDRATIIANPSTNHKLCFPQWWTPTVVPPVAVHEDIFHKYVVTSVISNPETGGGRDASQEMYYSYGTPSWRYDDSPFTLSKYRTWSDFAGFDNVEVLTGSNSDPSSQQDVKYWYYQGRDGSGPSGSTISASVTAPGTSSVADSLWFAGQVRESQTYDGSGSGKQLVSTSVMTPWTSNPTATDQSYWTVGADTTVVTEPVSSGGTRTATTKTTYSDSTGPWLPVTVETVNSDTTSTCTTTTYAASTGGIAAMPSEVQEVGTTCADVASASYPQDAISDTRYYYDSGALGAAPTKGDITETDIVDKYTGATADTAHWQASSKATFDTMGRPLTTTDILGNVTKSTYTPAATAAAGSGPLTSQTLTNQDNWTTTTAYNPAWGAPTSVTDANGHVTTAAYDSLGRRTGVWYADRPQASHATSPSVQYNYVLSRTAANAVETITASVDGGIPEWTLYDGLGRPVQTQSNADGGSGTDVTDTVYDSAGNVAATNQTYWTASVSPSATLFVPISEASIPSEDVSSYHGAGRVTTQALDSYGVEQFHTSTAYQGADEVDFTAAAGGTSTSTFTNSLGQTTKLEQYLATAPSPTATHETTTYGYDVRGNQTSMTDPAGNAWGWTYDILGNQIQEVDPDTGTTTSSYDDAGNLLTQTDGRGQTLAYTYDDQSRKTAEYKGSSSSTGSLLASWTYDTVSKGQLSSSSSYTGSVPGTPGLQYKNSITAYDVDDRPTSTTVSIPSGAPAFGGTTYTNTAHYNVDGSLNYATYPAEGGLPAETETYGYNGNGEVSGIVTPSMTIQVAYDAIGNLAQLDRLGAHEVVSSYVYDPATNAQTRVMHTQFAGTTPTVLDDSDYAYDDSGEVTSIKATSDVLESDYQCFQYDQLQDLTQAWTPADADCSTAPSSSNLGGIAPYWTSYTVDPQTGNRTSTTENPTTVGGVSSTDTYSYPVAGDGNPHAVQSVMHVVGDDPTSSSYSYDAAGNTTGRPAQTLSYNATGQLGSVTVGDDTESNVYDADGSLLLLTDSSSGSTLFLGPTELHVDAAGDAATATRTYEVGSVPIAERSTTVGSSTATQTWLCADAQGTVGLEVDATTGTLTARQQDPFGNPRGTALASWSDDHGYLNATTSALTDLIQLGARLYDPSIGKFLSVDPVLDPGDPQQDNGYSYAHNNPITESDPTGLLSSGALGCALMVSGCQGVPYKSGKSAEKAPAAAGSGEIYKKVSPHVVVSEADPYLSSMISAYAQAKSSLGWSVKTPSQEMSVWALACMVMNPAACDPYFKSGVVYESTQWFPSDTTKEIGEGDVWAVTPGAATEPLLIVTPPGKWDEAVEHAREASGADISDTLTVNRLKADDNRAASLKGIPTKKGYDRDEWPPAATDEGGAGASVRYVVFPDNRGFGSFLGNKLRGYPDGTKYRVVFPQEGLSPEGDVPAP